MIATSPSLLSYRVASSACPLRPAISFADSLVLSFLHAVAAARVFRRPTVHHSRSVSTIRGLVPALAATHVQQMSPRAGKVRKDVVVLDEVSRRKDRMDIARKYDQRQPRRRHEELVALEER
ncbi:hypothetical protein ACHAW5_009669 [Stephanodiscus triporus]|uniref:Uncharacterized protein n=1 Tax=Stephanodiscus triporus TaxID=2934178 RepID=A0ABD3N227_9STRA